MATELLSKKRTCWIQFLLLLKTQEILSGCFDSLLDKIGLKKYAH